MPVSSDCACMGVTMPLCAILLNVLLSVAARSSVAYQQTLGLILQSWQTGGHMD